MKRTNPYEYSFRCPERSPVPASTSRVRGRTIAECPTVSGEAAVRAAARVGQAVTLRSGRLTNAGCGARGRRRTRVTEREWSAVRRSHLSFRAGRCARRLKYSVPGRKRAGGICGAPQIKTISAEIVSGAADLWSSTNAP